MKIRNRKASTTPSRRAKPNSARSCRSAQGRISTLTSSLALLIGAASIALFIAVAEPEKSQEAEEISPSPRSNPEGRSLDQRASPEDKGHTARRESRTKTNTEIVKETIPELRNKGPRQRSSMKGKFFYILRYLDFLRIF